MAQYINKSALVAEIKRRINEINLDTIEDWRYRLQREHDIEVMKNILSFLDTLEVKDPYEQCVQYDSIKAGIQDYAETYSFNIESQLFPQLTKEQQTLWRKEIEQACISGGDAGVGLARDIRYKENFETKEVDLIVHTIIAECCDWLAMHTDLSHDEIEGCRNLMLTVKEEQCKARKGEEV